MTSTLTRLAALALFAPALAAAPAAAAVVDQSQLSFNTGVPFYLSGSNGLPVGQSFTAGLHGTLAAIRIFSNGYIHPDGATNDLDLDITGPGGYAVSLTRTVSSVYDDDLGLYGVLIDVSALGRTVYAGQVYTFTFTGVSGPGDLYTRGIVGSDSNPYAGGREYNILYGDQPDYDLSFQTLVTPVPEPSSWALLVAGFAVAGTQLRRRRVAAA